MPNTLTSSLTPVENKALKEAFCRYVDSFDQKMKLEERVRLANNLVDLYLPTFKDNPEVQKLIAQSENPDNIFKFMPADIAHLTAHRELNDYRKPRKSIRSIKGRLIIFSLEILGFYFRPPNAAANYLHTAIIEDLFRSSTKQANTKAITSNKEMDEVVLNGYFKEKLIKRIIGTYQLFRLSLNNSFPGCVAVHTLRIYKDKEDPSVIRYSTLNSYKQFQSVNQNKGLKRKRESHGHVYNYQGQILFLGGTLYTHLDECESGDLENNYPEIMMLHSHSGDTNNIRGLILGQFPLLGLPVATSVYMSKLDSKSADELEKLEDLDPKDYQPKDIELIARYYGNIDPRLEPARNFIINEFTLYLKKLNFSKADGTLEELHEKIITQRKELHKKVKEIHNFIVNKIEDTYSHMLTP